MCRPLKNENPNENLPTRKQKSTHTYPQNERRKENPRKQWPPKCPAVQIAQGLPRIGGWQDGPQKKKQVEWVEGCCWLDLVPELEPEMGGEKP